MHFFPSTLQDFQHLKQSKSGASHYLLVFSIDPSKDPYFLYFKYLWKMPNALGLPAQGSSQNVASKLHEPATHQQMAGCDPREFIFPFDFHETWPTQNVPRPIGVCLSSCSRRSARLMKSVSPIALGSTVRCALLRAGLAEVKALLVESPAPRCRVRLQLPPLQIVPSQESMLREKWCFLERW